VNCSRMQLTEKDIKEMAARWLPEDRLPRRIRVHTDTTEFFRIEYDDAVILKGHPYLIRHNAKEGRFGIDDEIKFWVKRAIDLKDGSHKIIKLVFYEKFKVTVGDIEFRCFRSPRKEARILKLVENHRNFMHGFSTEDEKGNIIRVLDMIKGKRADTLILNTTEDHETYFNDYFPGIFANYVECVKAIGFLHDQGEKHGDIRRDHILVDEDTGAYRWIDFDFNYRHRENIYGYDLFGLGNILAFLIGKGDALTHELKKKDASFLENIREEDMNIIFHNRVMNLKKIYPYIPQALNEVLMHFAAGTKWFYENTTQLLDDMAAIFPPAKKTPQKEDKNG
jgi:hypothetical protein